MKTYVCKSCKRFTKFISDVPRKLFCRQRFIENNFCNGELEISEDFENDGTFKEFLCYNCKGITFVKIKDCVKESLKGSYVCARCYYKSGE